MLAIDHKPHHAKLFEQDVYFMIQLSNAIKIGFLYESSKFRNKF